MADVDDWLDLMEAKFPMRTGDGNTELAFVRDGSRDDDGTLKAVIRIIVFDEFDGERMIRDVKEMEVAAGVAENLDYLDRYAVFLDALGAVVGQISTEEVDASMPYEVFPADVLDLQATTYDEFTKALSAKSRLGEYMS